MTSFTGSMVCDLLVWGLIQEDGALPYILFVGNLTVSHPIDGNLEKIAFFIDINNNKKGLMKMKFILSAIAHYLRKLFVSNYSDIWNR